MLTHCPHCDTWFRLRAEHLAVANGMVTCGRCEQVFNALASLAEETPPRIELAVAAPGTHAPAPVAPALPPASAPPAAVAPDADPSTRTDAALAPLTQEIVSATSAPSVAPARAGVSSTYGERLSADEHAILFTAPGVEEAIAVAAAGPSAAVPVVLADDVAALARAPARRAFGWIAFMLALATLLAAQLGFAYRVQLLTHVPLLAPLIDYACARIACAERRLIASGVRLLARDVREHPQYADALLVNATIVNDAAVPSPYPVIDLRLRDAAGAVLAARRFEPREYLDHSIEIAAGMPHAQPIYIVMELAGQAAQAVSFEFTFL